MILVAFLFPLAMYLLILGTINRRHHPLMVPGPWDFAGVLFAVSGFLLFGGPGALSVLNDRWRDSLVYGQDPTDTSAHDLLWMFWLFLMTVYFLFVTLGSAFFLLLARRNTSIYNVDAAAIQEALGRIFARLGLRPVRSGDMYFFGKSPPDLTAERALKSFDVQGIQTADDSNVARKEQPTPSSALHNVMLEVDAFPAMWHVTLRWDPPRSGLRQEIERELANELNESLTPSHMLGGWLTLVSCALFFLTFVIGFGVLIYRILNRIM